VQCRAWVYRLEHVVQSLFDNAEFAASVGRHRDPNDPACIFSTPAMKAQNAALNAAFDVNSDVLTVPFELGGDGVQVWSFRAVVQEFCTPTTIPRNASAGAEFWRLDCIYCRYPVP
jgi:hypothetical protein